MRLTLPAPVETTARPLCRVLLPDEMNAWLGAERLADWVERQRGRALAHLEEELADWAEARRADMETAFLREQASLRDEAAKALAIQVAALRTKTAEAAAEMAARAAAAVRQILSDDQRVGHFQELVLQALLPRLADMPSLVIHVHPAALARTSETLTELLPDPDIVATIVADDRMGTEQCRVRCEDQMFDADLDEWVCDLRGSLLSCAQERGLFPHHDDLQHAGRRESLGEWPSDGEDDAVDPADEMAHRDPEVADAEAGP